MEEEMEEEGREEGLGLQLLLKSAVVARQDPPCPCPSLAVYGVVAVAVSVVVPQYLPMSALHLPCRLQPTPLQLPTTAQEEEEEEEEE